MVGGSSLPRLLPKNAVGRTIWNWTISRVPWVPCFGRPTPRQQPLAQSRERPMAPKLKTTIGTRLPYMCLQVGLRRANCSISGIRSRTSCFIFVATSNVSPVTAFAPPAPGRTPRISRHMVSTSPIVRATSSVDLSWSILFRHSTTKSAFTRHMHARTCGEGCVPPARMDRQVPPQSADRKRMLTAIRRRSILAVPLDT